MTFPAHSRTREHRVPSGSSSGRARGEIRANHPAARITRQASTNPELVEVQEWNGYLNNLGDINTFNGRALALGSVHVTYVTANNIRTLLQDKYPKAYPDPRRARSLVRKFREAFNNFTHQDQHIDVIESPFGDIELHDEGVFDPSDIDPTEWAVKQDTTFDRDKWHPCFFSFTSEGVFGKSSNKFGIIPDEQCATLSSEAASCIEFLKEVGLNTDRLDPNPVIHAVLYEGFQAFNLDNGLYVPRERPLNMWFDAPKVHTNI